MNNDDLRIDWCSYKAAKYAVMKWHYSKKMPVGKTVKCGVWELGKYVGCVIFSHTVGAMSAKSLGLSNFQVCELVRVALGDHVTPVTRIIKICISMLKKHCPKLEVIVSYADPEWNHLGIIYQAGNWIYIGESSPSLMYIINGSKVHSRTANPNNKHFGRLSKNVNTVGCIKYKSRPKYKYLYPLTGKMRVYLSRLTKSYPKCLASINGNALADQARDGGSIPTARLTGKGVELIGTAEG